MKLVEKHKQRPLNGTPQTVEKQLVAFVREKQGYPILASEMPLQLREEMSAYRSVLEKNGFSLISPDTHPHLLVQGQFMFWPTGQDFSAFNPPQVQVYSPVVEGRPIGIDLFAGAGGLSLGFEQAGFDIAACVEIDPIHCATHEYNFPYSTTICTSVTDITGQDIRNLAGLGSRDIEVVFGGAPCQGFSLIGKRALDDPRNQLVAHYVRLVSELRPKYCVFENVKGLTVGKHVKFLQELISSLEASGYQVTQPYQVLNAADYGVPQNRHRLFLLAARLGEKPPSYPSPSQARTTVAEAIDDLPDADQFPTLLHEDCVAAQWNTQFSYARRLREPSQDPSNYGYPRDFDANVLTSSLRTVHTQKTEDRFLSTPSGETEPISRFLKLDPNGQCNTLRAGTDSARGAFTSPRPIHPKLPRVITVREAARLHSYPDWFRFHFTKWHGFRQIGNSVPPQLGRAVAAEIMKALSIQPSLPLKDLVTGSPSLLAFTMKQAASHFGVSSLVVGQRIRKNEDACNEKE